MMMMMQGAAGEPKNKEQFKLLQYSDDSKSLSDLELAEIVVPRKRKVRRKTKPKNGHRHRKPLSDQHSATGPCKNIGVWVAIASNVGWLLILSYIVSMVHSEYATLARQQTKLAANVKTLPDEWHDTSHSLEVNQSTLFHKLFELQQRMDNLTEDLLQLRAVVQQQQAQASDWSRVALLEKSLADFGASLESFSSEMELLKNRSAKATETLAEHTQAVEYFRAVVTKRRLNESEEGAGDSAATRKVEQEIVALRNVTQSIADRLERVNGTLSGFVAEERLKVDGLEKEHTKRINELNDSVANVTAQDVNKAMQNYQDQIRELGERLAGLEKRSEVLQQGQRGVEELRSQLDGFNAAMQRLQQKGVAEKGEEKRVEEGKSGSAPVM